MGKLTWEDLYKDFRKRFPNLCKRVIYYQPHGFGQIKLELDDGRELIYDHEEKTAWFVKKE